MPRLASIALTLAAAGLVALVASAAGADPKPLRPPSRAPARQPGARPHHSEDRPWLGIGLGVGQRGGVRVTLVVKGTPADEAGLAIGDEILAIDRRPIVSPDDLVDRIRAMRVGQRVRLEVQRKTRRFVASARLSNRLEPGEELERQRLDRQAPEFEVRAISRDSDQEGRAISLASLRGKVVVVEFLATWCGPCKTTYPVLSDLQDRRAGDGLVVLGVSSESEAALRAMIEQHPISFRIARDVGAATHQAFHEGVGPIGTPTLFVIDRKGVVRFAGLGAGLTADHAVFAAERALASDE